MGTARYIELNPVKDRLVSKSELWKYSSVASHIYGKEDALLSSTSQLKEMIGRLGRVYSSGNFRSIYKNVTAANRHGVPPNLRIHLCSTLYSIENNEDISIS